MPGLSPEEEAVWIQQSMKEGEQLDIVAIENSELVQKLLSQPESAEFGIYKFGDMELRYKPFLTSKLRSLLKRADKESKVEGADKLAIQDRIVYEGLAEICMDPALKKPLVWATIDARSNDGRVYKIFKDITEKIGAGEKSIKDFR
jgi:hypothetical protein